MNTQYEPLKVIDPYVEKVVTEYADQFKKTVLVPATNSTKKQSLNQQKWNLSIVTTLYALVFVIAAAVTVSITNERVERDVKVSFQDQIDRQAAATLSETGNLLTQLFLSWNSGIVNMLAETTSNSVRDGYSYSLDLPSYFDYNRSTLKQPLAIDERQPATVSFVASGYFVSGSSYDSQSNFSQEIVNYRNRTTTLDRYFKKIYNGYTKVFALYIGMPTNTFSFFRKYPGKPIEDRNYDPEMRPWYKDAVNSIDQKAVLTSPYADAFGGGWMVTNSVIIRNSTGGEIIGVAGADILITSIQELLIDLNILDSGKISLLEESGQVVADIEWKPNVTDKDAFNYTHLKNPAIEEDTWQIISSTPISVDSGITNKVITNSGYIIYVNHLAIYDGKYILLAAVKKSEVEEEMEETLTDLDEANTDILITLVVTFLIVIAVMFILITFLVRLIIHSIMSMTKDIDRLLENVGYSERSITSGMVAVEESTISEINIMHNNMSKLVNQFKESRNNEKQDIMTESHTHNSNNLFGIVPLEYLKIQDQQPTAVAIEMDNSENIYPQFMPMAKASPLEKN